MGEVLEIKMLKAISRLLIIPEQPERKDLGGQCVERDWEFIFAIYLMGPCERIKESGNYYSGAEVG